MRVSELLATKLVENEFAAYLELQALMASNDALSTRGFTIASYALCGFANLGSLGIQIGVLAALAPSRTRLIARIGPSALICGFISTLQAAGIACVYIIYFYLRSLFFVSADMFALLLALFAVACSSDPGMYYVDVRFWRPKCTTISACRLYTLYIYFVRVSRFWPCHFLLESQITDDR
jgi:hypothetical protein